MQLKNVPRQKSIRLPDDIRRAMAEETPKFPARGYATALILYWIRRGLNAKGKV